MAESYGTQPPILSVYPEYRHHAFFLTHLGMHIFSTQAFKVPMSRHTLPLKALVMVMLRQTIHLPMLATSSSSQDGANLSWMNPVKQHHDEEHQQRVEYVEICLMLEQIAIESLKILGRTKDGTDHDEEASHVQSSHMLPPRDAAVRAPSRHDDNGAMESYSNHNEEAKADELDKEPCDDDLRAGLEGIESSRGLVSATCQH